jgi:hypothetical protein
MNNEKINRRSFCSGMLGNGALLIGAGSLLTACGGGEKKTETSDEKSVEAPVEASASTGDPCTDFSQVEASELEKRKALGYVEKSPIPDNLCENCKLYIPGQPGSNCGGCQLFKGPVFLDAYCTYWADPAI